MVRGFATCLCNVLRLAAEVKKDVELSCCVLCTLVRGTDDTKDLTMLMQLIFHSCWYRHTCSLWSVVSRPFSFSDYTVMEPFMLSVVSRPCSCCDYCLSVRYTNMYTLVRGITIENCFYFIILHCLGSLAGIIFFFRFYWYAPTSQCR